MMKLAVVFVAVAIVSVSCGPVADRDAELEFELAKQECKRSINRAGTELANLYRRVNVQEISKELHDLLFKSYSEGIYAYNALQKVVADAESMNIVNGVYTAFGTEIHCSRDVAEAVAKVSEEVRNEFEKNGYVASFESAVTELDLAKRECKRSINKAGTELADLYRGVNVQEITEELHNVLFKAYSEGIYAYNALQKVVAEAQSMEVVKGVYTAFGTEILCSKDVARDVAKVSTEVRDVYKNNGYVANSYSAEFAAKKLELVKKECMSSIYKAGRELTEMYHGINPHAMTQDQNDVLFKAYVEGSQKFDALRKAVSEAKSFEAVDGFFTPLGNPLYCSKDVAEEVIRISNEVRDFFKKQGF